MSAVTSPAPATAAAPASNRLALTGVGFAVLFIASLVFSGLAGSATYPSPFEADKVAEAYFADNGGVVLGMGILQLLSAVPLAAFVLALTKRPGLARAGGLCAVAGLAACALIGLAIPVLDASGDALHTLHYLTFMAGGPAHVPFLGIVVGASALAFRASVPRWTTVLGLTSAGLALLSLASFVSESLMLLLPLGRFTAILWILVTAVRAARLRK
ncbi:hypothetical protein OG453_33995 [Streptomyces sp. NBC_01381]|uniref:hypothetical protein n=1 Tax=Streptomyces sp. NBC_01381 TaxID=2903845 RepID=UPI00224DA6F1|nr:hypothetical protein [Streptomyces sp. NBC_01381]MCX4671644.1 hypothetical protein [Streptomyces sp. NBC_01381]